MKHSIVLLIFLFMFSQPNHAGYGWDGYAYKEIFPRIKSLEKRVLIMQLELNNIRLEQMEERELIYFNSVK